LFISSIIAELQFFNFNHKFPQNNFAIKMLNKNIKTSICIY